MGIMVTGSFYLYERDIVAYRTTSLWTETMPKRNLALKLTNLGYLKTKGYIY